ncbi:hypothetical protein FRC10_002131 [Ceratobasidium sp. 414]|nr:hypothetical protein FRC10_002131 [Ceratobasidium sp. 414]
MRPSLPRLTGAAPRSYATAPSGKGDGGRRTDPTPADPRNDIIRRALYPIQRSHQVLLPLDFRNSTWRVEWLEEGRSIIWNQMFQLQTPLDQLSSVDVALAAELKEVARELEQVSSHSSTLEPKPNQLSLERTAQRHRHLDEERERLIEKARLHAPKESLKPRSCSPHGSCALTNSTHEKAFRARTKLARSHQAQGQTNRGVTNQPNKLEMEELLKMLWVGVAEPVLDFLGYICTIGPLSFLPLHAAGNYNTSGQLLFRCAISSFAPNLSALLTPPADPAAFSGILAISQACTLGFPPLLGTVEELDHIARQTGGARFTRFDGRGATCSAVLAAMDQHSWAHFACHASQNPAESTASAFHLHDGPLDLAAVTRKQLKHADLAFLSVRQTAKGDKELSEEAVHLAAGMIMAGYWTVIATMWSINDEDAPIVAEKFYAYMRRKHCTMRWDIFETGLESRNLSDGHLMFIWSMSIVI